jgi:hypothetical protein
MSRYRRSAALFVAGALAATPALAQQGEPIGSWWLLDMSGEAAPRHAIMTMSTQGSGVVAFQCAGGRSSVLLGMNKPEFRPEAGATVALDYQIGGGSRHQAQAALTSRDARVRRGRVGRDHRRGGASQLVLVPPAASRDRGDARLPPGGNR